jgi:hypothetical protein
MADPMPQTEIVFSVLESPEGAMKPALSAIRFFLRQKLWKN